MKFPFYPCFALFALLPLSALAQTKAAVVPTHNTAGQISISNAPGGAATYDAAQGLARITKDVIITQNGENLVIYAQDVSYLRNQRRMNASGQLRALTRDSTIRGQKLKADFEARQFTLSGNVIITSHGKNDGAGAIKGRDDVKKPIRILCDQVIWDYEKKQAIATGHVRVVQGENQFTGDKLLYDENQNVAKLLGNAYWDQDHKLVTTRQEFDIYVDTDLISYPRGCPNFPPRNIAYKNLRSQKTFRPFKPVPALPLDLLVSTNIPVPTVEPASAFDSDGLRSGLKSS